MESSSPIFYHLCVQQFYNISFGMPMNKNIESKGARMSLKNIKLHDLPGTEIA